jgi:hypothetical protein
VPPLSRANVEQTYFDTEFGAFFRINTGWITPFKSDEANYDLFQTQYLNLVYYLQAAIVTGEAELNGMTFTLDDFCYKPITGEGCIVESPMQYFKSNITPRRLHSVSHHLIRQSVLVSMRLVRLC